MKLKPKKSLGQHFLTDQNILRKIAEASIPDEQHRLIEIGPGEGALTEWLAKVSSDLHVIEVDRRAVEILENRFPDINIIQQDILLVNWDDILLENGKNAITGNIPYYITSPILFKVMDAGPVFSQAVFLMQKDVAERLVAKPGSKTYGILSVQAQLFGKVEYLFSVSRHVFRPPPKVESAVIRFSPVSRDFPVSIDQLKTVIRTAFNQRRKMLSNSLKSLINSAEDIDFDLTQRPEQLQPEEFVELTRQIYGV